MARSLDQSPAAQDSEVSLRLFGDVLCRERMAWAQGAYEFAFNRLNSPTAQRVGALLPDTTTEDWP